MEDEYESLDNTGRVDEDSMALHWAPSAYQRRSGWTCKICSWSTGRLSHSIWACRRRRIVSVNVARKCEGMCRVRRSGWIMRDWVRASHDDIIKPLKGHARWCSIVWPACHSVNWPCQGPSYAVTRWSEPGITMMPVKRYKLGPWKGKWRWWAGLTQVVEEHTYQWELAHEWVRDDQDMWNTLIMWAGCSLWLQPPANSGCNGQ
jgi:hypothetical protein